jgi:cell fate (sporulation/competence/biofilm development) regulator YmcA (YheA/YmcA/DUF963 family)
MCRKLEKQAIELIENDKSNNLEKCKGIAKQLKAKLELLGEIDNEILNIWDVNDIQQEIEEAAQMQHFLPICL